MKQHQPSFAEKRSLRRFIPVALTTALVTSGCTNTPTHELLGEQDFQDCLRNASVVDKEAHSANGEPKYLLSAKILERCSSLADELSVDITAHEHMTTLALASLNYARGGDIRSAARVLKTFESKFPSKDLYLADADSFVDTMRVITSNDVPGISQLRIMNVNKELRREMIRLNDRSVY